MKSDAAANRLYEAWNETEHANRMTEGARASLERGDVSCALDDLRIARGAAERAVSKLRYAFEELEALQRDGRSSP